MLYEVITIITNNARLILPGGLYIGENDLTGALFCRGPWRKFNFGFAKIERQVQIKRFINLAKSAGLRTLRQQSGLQQFSVILIPAQALGHP